jgi:hypothetical protein
MQVNYTGRQPFEPVYQKLKVVGAGVVGSANMIWDLERGGIEEIRYQSSFANSGHIHHVQNCFDLATRTTRRS